MDAAIEALIDAVEALANNNTQAAWEAISRAKLAISAIPVLEDEGEWDKDLKARKERG